MSDEFLEIFGVPCGSFSAQLDGSFVVDGADEIDGEVSDDGHFFSAVALSHARLVVVEDDVKRPVQRVFDGPMAADNGGSAICGERCGRDEVAGVEAAAILEFGA